MNHSEVQLCGRQTRGPSEEPSAGFQPHLLSQPRLNYIARGIYNAEPTSSHPSLVQMTIRPRYPSVDVIEPLICSYRIYNIAAAVLDVLLMIVPGLNDFAA